MVAVLGLLIIIHPHCAQHSFISSYRYLVIAFRSKYRYSFISSYRYSIDIWREMNRRKIGTDTTTTKTQHRSSEFSYILQYIYIYICIRDIPRNSVRTGSLTYSYVHKSNDGLFFDSTCFGKFTSTSTTIVATHLIHRE